MGNIVAFHAKTLPHQGHLQINQSFLFHDVTQNVGNAYDSNTGIFTCPISGLYLFSMTILSNPNRIVETELVLDGRSIMRVYSASDGSAYNSGTNTVIQSLKQGDKIWARIVNSSSQDHNNIIVYGSKWSTLSGFLIKQS